MHILFAWPEGAILIGIIIVVSVVVHGLLIFTINRIVQRIRDHQFAANTLSARAARVMAQASGFSVERHRQRTETIGGLLRSLVSLIVFTIMGLTILSLIGVPMTPLLASAGVGGIAFGFGAQALVKDFLSGLFMMIEDQYGVGDVVKIGDVTGTVEQVSLRVTKVRDASGQAWYIRNGEVVTVGNVSQGWSTAIVDVPVAYDELPEKVMGILSQVADEIDADPKWADVLLDRPNLAGVESIVGGTMSFRLIAKCAANQQWGIQRELRERAKTALDAAGVRGPRLIQGQQ